MVQKKKISLLYRKREKRALNKLILSFFILVFLFIIVVFWGIPLLANLASIISSRFDKDKEESLGQQFPLPTPEIFDLPQATNSAKLTVLGKGLPNTTVEIFIDNKEVGGVIVGEDGIFEVPNVNLSEGENLISAQSVGQKNEKSARSEPKTVIYNKEPPKLSLNEPQDNQKISGGERKIKVSGSTESDVNLKIGEFLAVVDQNGNFTFSYPLKDGENKIIVKAEDKAGNTTEIERTVFYSP